MVLARLVVLWAVMGFWQIQHYLAGSGGAWHRWAICFGNVPGGGWQHLHHVGFGQGNRWHQGAKFVGSVPGGRGQH
eukprot:11464850-Ditylum_brightwellii.AAC.1